MQLPEDTPTPKGCGHILVIDDNRSLLQTAETMLKHLGYSVSTMNNISEVIKILKENANQYNLLIIDQTMPIIHGVDLIDIIRPFNPKVPIIMTSSFDRKVNQTDHTEFGIVNYITKPFTMRSLGVAIQEALTDTVQSP